MAKYNIIEFVEYFDKSKDKVDLKEDALESNSKILYPGRFYVLNYMAKTKDVFNSRPVIISIGISKSDPDSFLCIDLSILPKKVRLKFIEMYFNLYYKEIMENMNKYFFVKDADKQDFMKSFNYANICKAVPMIPLKHAIKKYKIQNTIKIYSIPFSKVYRFVGDYCDENYYVNGNVKEIQMEFLKKMSR